jgi:pimeloyl-ACP methyl ester carboxylesterase
VLERIPLEYFARAARWLRGAGHGRVAVWGVSRGSEPALLLAASYPRLAGAVIAGSPISVVNGAFSWAHPLPPGLPAWTLRGRPLPVARPAGDPASRGNPAAVIPVERIRGPVLLLAGAADKLWPSAACAAATMHRLAAHHDWFPHRDLLLAGAGHAAGLAFPCDAASTAGLGGTRIATSAAETVACHAVLRFLATAGRYRVAG